MYSNVLLSVRICFVLGGFCCLFVYTLEDISKRVEGKGALPLVRKKCGAIRAEMKEVVKDPNQNSEVDSVEREERKASRGECNPFWLFAPCFSATMCRGMGKLAEFLNLSGALSVYA